MNKKQAKRIALELVLCIIDMEIFSPSELPYQLLFEYGFTPEDFPKLRDAVEDIAAELKNKMDKMDGVLDHNRKYGNWMFLEEKEIPTIGTLKKFP